MQEAFKVSRSLMGRAVPPGYGGAPSKIRASYYVNTCSPWLNPACAMHTDPDSVLIIPLQGTQSFAVYYVQPIAPA